jgi:hypothetical protein
MFQALLSHLQEVLLKQQLVFCMLVMSGGCYRSWSGTPALVAANRCNAHAKYQFLVVKRLLKMSN